MIATSSLGTRLRQARELAELNQHDAAEIAGVAREVISYWENDRRIPSLVHLNRLADLYGVSVGSLAGTEPALIAEEEHELLFRGLRSQPPRTKAEVRRWLTFLDDWADLLTLSGEGMPGRAMPPNRSWRSAEPLTDSRTAPRLAVDVRRHYGLGLDAIPDLLTFLDQHDVLVCRIPLDPIGEGEGVSGVFYNHPRLGYCILVNTRTTPGRQTFTLAHEFAHALFHYQERGLVSRTADPDRKERFADAFAAHFLVPSEQLREIVARRWAGAVDSPLEVIHLHRLYRVSYATMLNRLRSEGLLTPQRYQEFRQYSPAALASQLGLDCAVYYPAADTCGSIASYPMSVLGRVRAMVDRDELTPAGAAGLLGLSQEEVLLELMAAPRQASDQEVREFTELPVPPRPRKRDSDTEVW